MSLLLRALRLTGHRVMCPFSTAGMTSDTPSTSTPRRRRFDDDTRQIFVGNLDWITGTHQLRQHFRQFGRILGVVLPFEKSGLTRGFAFVTFARQDSVDKALAFTGEHTVDGRHLQVALPARMSDAHDDDE